MPKPKTVTYPSDRDLHVWVDRKLYEKIANAARINERSMTGEVRKTLRDVYNAP